MSFGIVVLALRLRKEIWRWGVKYCL